MSEFRTCSVQSFIITTTRGSMNGPRLELVEATEVVSWFCVCFAGCCLWFSQSDRSPAPLLLVSVMKRYCKAKCSWINSRTTVPMMDALFYMRLLNPGSSRGSCEFLCWKVSVYTFIFAEDQERLMQRFGFSRPCLPKWNINDYFRTIDSLKEAVSRLLT